ncbi:gliding motility-associated C-terminal domain-containing protein [Emticicia sp. SJ17W-69]|uniref:T9SS type B sorting domain-containing protein n=1 Tax=Emticicia sp. SJ17W-69 TaxID=3421657 RepID=UPI003EB86774
MIGSFERRYNKKNVFDKTPISILAGFADISLTQSVNATSISEGNNATFTLTLSNEGQTNVSGVIVTDTLPLGITLVSVNPSVGTTSVNGNTLTWDVGAIHSSTSLITLTFVVKVNDSGIFYNSAEITAMNELDIDSTPKNNKLNEDDISMSCISVPYKYCSKDLIEIKAEAPAGYTNYQWFKDGVLIEGATGQIYTIVNEGSYTFTADTILGNSTCSSSLCCPIMVERYPAITLVADTKQPSCGLSNGVVNLHTTGGINPFTYSIDGVVFSNDSLFSNLAAGTYNFIVKDSKGCTSNIDVTLEPSSGPLLSINTSTAPSCGLSNGSVTLTVTGGISPFTYSIGSGGFRSSNVFSNLGSGVHTFSVIDSKGCSASSTVTLVNEGSNLIVTNGVVCDVLGNGKVSLQATGGKIPYEYSDGTGFVSTNEFDHVSLGTYTYTVKDAAGCIATTAVDVTCNVVCQTDPYKYCFGDLIEIRAEAPEGYTNYQWFKDGVLIAGASDHVYTIVSEGSYSFTVDIVSGNSTCSGSLCCPIVVERFPELTLAVTSMQPVCGSSSGIVTLTASNGSGSYVYSMDGVNYGSSNVFSGLSASTYVFYVKDGNGCVKSVAMVLTSSPSNLSLSATSTEPMCGSSSGIVTLTASNGSGSYVYSKDGVNYGSSNVFSGLSASTYVFYVKDGNGCVKTTSIILTNQNSNLSLTGKSDCDVTLGNGTVTLTASGGTYPYEYSNGSGFVSNNIFDNLSTGTYSYTVKDQKGCTSTTNVEVNCSVVCNSVVYKYCYGELIEIKAEAPAGYKNYQWFKDGVLIVGANEQVYTIVSEGNYTFTADLVASNTNSVCSGWLCCPIKVERFPEVILTATSTEPTCGSSSGIVTLTASNGSGSYVYSKDGVNYGSSNVFSGLSASSYVFYVKDGNGCVKSVAVVLTSLPSDLSLSATSLEPTCGSSSGIVTLTASNGSGSYVYSKDGVNYGSSNVFSGLSASSYVFYVKDGNGCVKSVAVVLTSSPSDLSLSARSTEPTCGSSSGIVTLIASNGSGSYVYSKDGMNYGSSNVFSGLSASTYVFYVKDGNGCVKSVAVVLTSLPSDLSLSARSTEPTCGSSSGIVTLTASNGSGSYVYSKDGVNYGNSNVFSGLSASSYVFYVKDGNGCVKSVAVVLTSSPSDLSLSATSTEPTCGSSSGIVTLTASNGSGSYVYSMDGVNYGSSNVFSGLSASSYVFYVKDGNGCVKSVAVVLTSSPSDLSLSARSTEPTCGSSSGIVTLTASNGSGSYVYSKDGVNYGSSNVFSGLSASSYVFYVKDGNGCVKSIAVVLTSSPSNLSLSATSTEPTCGSSSGSVTLTASNGSGSYVYSKDGMNYGSSNVFSGLSASSYVFYVKDGNGCVKSVAVVLTSSPSNLSLSARLTEPMCGSSSGIVTLIASNGSGSYVYSKDGMNYGSSNVFSGLSASTYVFYVKDGNGCVKSVAVVLTSSPSDLSLSATSTEPMCGSSSGSVSLTASNGSGSYVYSKDGVNYGSSNVFSGLSASSYVFYVKDGNGCVKSVAVVLTSSPSNLSLSVTSTEPTCGSSSGIVTLTASNGSGSYVYSKDGVNYVSSNVFSGLSASTYVFYVKDENGCVKSVSLELINSLIFKPTIGVNSPLCENETIILTSSGGKNYFWTGPNNFTSSLQNPTIPLSSKEMEGVYKVIVSDINGCVGTATTNVIINNIPKIIPTNTIVCEGQNITLAAPEYGIGATYEWKGPNNLFSVDRIVDIKNATQLNVGLYLLKVTKNNCTTTGTVIVDVNAKPSSPVISGDAIVCNGSSAILNAEGCNNGEVIWSNNTTGKSIIINKVGTYSAKCKVGDCLSDVSNILNIVNSQIPATPIISTINLNLCDKESTVLTAIGCGGTIKWNTGETGNNLTVYVSGTYTAICYNICGVSGISNQIIINKGISPTSPLLSTNKNKLCNNESAILSATGCSGIIKWSTGATIASISVSTAGSYTAICSNSCGESGISNAVIISTGNSPATPVISTTKNSLCNNESAILSATGCSGIIKWSTGATTASISVSTAGSYTATCSNSCGESGISNAVIISTGNNPATPVISTTKNSLCNNESAILSATGCSGIIKWSTGATTASISVSTAGSYTAICSNSCGESGISNAVIISTGNSPATPVISTTKNSLCNNESAILSATGCSGIIKWSTGATTASISVSTAGSYTATCSNSCGESGISNAVIISTGNSPATPVISTTKNSLCNNESAILSATGCSGIIKWSTGATIASISVSTAGSYTAICSNSCGESGISNAVIISTGNSPATPVISTTKNSLCNNESAILSATGCSGIIKWSTGATTASISVSTAGSYTATCSNSCGESGISNAVIISTGNNPATPVISTTKNSLCNNESAILSATGCSGIIKWSTGATTASISVSTAGSYTATCSNSCGESGVSNAVIISTGNSPATPVISTTKNSLCNNESAILSATGCSGIIKWSTGATTASISVSTAGSYTVTCSNSCGESGISNAVIISTGNSPATPVISTTKNSLCNNESAILSATGCSGIIKWSTGATTASISVSTAGSYTATCSNSCGESGISNAVIISTGNNPATPVISTTKNSLCNNESAILSATGCSGIIKWSTGATIASISVSTAGSYTAICSNSCGESGISNAVIISTGNSPATPVISTTKNSLCNNESAILSATGCSGIIKWSTGATTASISVSTAGSYTATCSNSCGESGISNAVIISTGNNPATPVISTTKNSLCNNESAILSATGCSGIIKWSTGATIASISVSTAGSYTAICSNSCGESGISNAVIISTGNSPATPVISTTKNSLCNNESAILSATGCSGIIKWSTGATTASISVSTAGSYTATCSNSCGESGISNAVIISTGNNPATPVISTTKNSLCNNESAILSATGCSGIIKWSTGATTASISVSTAGSYTATCSNSCGESGISNAVIISTGSIPATPVISTTKNSLCNNESAILSATGCSGSIKWSTGATTASISVSTAGSYTATCSNSCGESGISNAVIISTGNNPATPVISTTKNSLCNNESAILSATGCSGIIKWSTGATTASISVSTAGSYTATCSNSCGESGVSNAVIISTGNSPATPVISTTKNSLCNNESAILSATGCSGIIKWSTGATTASISVSTAGSYTVTCSNSCGESGISNAVIISTGNSPATPVISTTKNSLCNNESAILSATGCSGSIKWSTGATTASISVSTAGSYTATCSNSCGESGISNAVIISTGNNPATPVISTTKNSLCNNESAILSATGCSGIIKWSTGATIASISVSTAGSYTAICSNSCGESGISNAVIISTGNSPATPVISTTKNSLCNNESAILSATGCSGIIKWSTGATTASISVSTAGSYTATCSNSCGESGISNAVIISTGNNPATPVISTTKNSLCNNESAILSATGCSGIIKWSTGATIASISVSTAGSYTAICSNSCGESGISNAVIISTGNSPATPVISTTKNSLCNNESAILSATGCSGSIKWSTGATTASISVSTAGSYTATCSNSCGESGISNAVIISTGNNPATPVISTTKNSLCNNESAILSATGCSGIIKWSTGATTASISVSTAGSYTVTCSNSCGESGISNAVIISTGNNPATPVISTTKNSLCNNESAILSATGCSGIIKWSTGATTASISVSTAGSYTATCSNSCGESGISNAVIISTGNNPATPVISTTKNSLCNNESAILSATGCSGIIKWSTGATTASISVSTAGSYTAICSNSCGESGISNAVIISTGSIPATPVISTTKNSLCNNESAILSATGCSGSIKWSTGATTASISVSTAGSYTATCSNSCGESGISNAVIISTGNNPATPVISTTKNSLCNNESAILSATGCSGIIKWSTGATIASISVSTAGSYTAICSNSCGESGISNAVIISTGNSPATPVISTTKNSLCNNESAILSATGCSGIIKWSTGATTASISVSTAGSYTATCSNSCGESGISNAVIISTGNNPATPVISTTKNSLCNNESAILSATGCSGIIKWSTGATTASISVSTAGSYTATCSNSCGESGISNAVIISTGSIPATPVISTTKNSLCNNESAILSATGCSGSIKWSTGATTASISVSTAGSYTATCSNSCGESGISNAVIISTGNNPATPVISTTKNSLCNNESAILSATGCSGIIKWSTGATTASISVSTAGSYTATCSNSCGESGISNAVIISTGNNPATPVISTTKNSLCNNESAILSATGCSGIIKWSTGATTASISVSTAGSYTVTCSNSCGESGISNAVIISTGNNPATPVISTTKNSLCNNESAILSATGCSGIIKWSTGATTASISVSTAGSYTAICSNSCGESGISNAVIISTGSIPATPVISTTKNSLCNNESAILSATGCSGSIKWSTGATTASISVSTAGSYTATCSNSCGESGISNAVIISTGNSPATPVISTTKNSLCNNESAILSATGCSGIIKWSTGATTASISVSTAGSYTATCSNSCGESGISNAVIISTGNNPATPVISTTKNSLCNNESAILSATGCSGIIKWSTGATTASISVSTAGTYTAICSNSCGESGVSNAVIISTGNSPATPVISTTKNSLCNNESAILSATGCSGIIKWSTGATTASISVSTAGSYTATCSNSCGESGISNAVIISTGNSPATPVISTTKNSLCNNESAILSATGCSGIIKWSTGATIASISVSTAGSYTATCSNSCGESGISNAVIISTGNSPATPVISTTKNSLCNNESAILSATGCSGIIKWSTGATTASISVSTAGSYTATCSNSCGESGISNAVIISTGNSPATPVISTTKNSLCNNESAILSATGCSGIIKWSTGATTASISVSTAGSYTATCSNSCGESGISNAVIISTGNNPATPVISTTKNSLCNNESAILSATGCSGSIKWSTGATTASISVSTAGTYTAICSNSCGESGISNAVIISTGSIPATPVISTTKNSLCNNESAILSATGCSGSIKWSTGATTASISVSTAGSYTAICSNSCGESGISNAVIISTGNNPATPVISTTKNSLCNNESAILSATGCSGIIKWSTGATTASISVSTAGSYTATCSNSCGESGISNAVIISTGNNPATPVISTTKNSLCNNESAILSATGCSGIIKWSTGATTASISVSTAGSYTATCSNSCGESAISNPISITNNTIPNAPLLSIDKTICCEGSNANLTASNCNGTLIWNTQETTATIKVYTSGTYTAICNNSCGSSSSSKIVTITSIPPVNTPVLNSDNTSLCGTEKAIIAASGCNGNLLWSTGETTTTISVSISGTYTAICTNICGQSGVSNAIIVTAGGLPLAPVLNSDNTSLCGTEKATITASGCNGNLLWNTGETTTTISVSISGTYTAICSNTCGQSGISNGVVISSGIVPSPPRIDSDNLILCGTETTIIKASGCSGQLKWNTGAISTSISVSSSGTYAAVCTNACGESGVSNEVVITNGTMAIPLLKADKSIVCGGEEVILYATGCTGSVIWINTNQIGTSIKVIPSVTTTYSAKCVDGACESSVSDITITVTPNSGSLTVTGPTVACLGSEVVLKAGGCTGKITWSNGATGSEIKVIVTETKTYLANCGSNQSSCDFNEGTIRFKTSGGSSGTGITTRYLLLGLSGNILQIADTPTFENVSAGSYNVLAITFRETIQGLIVGENISNVKSNCLARTEKTISVCSSNGSGCQSSGQIQVTLQQKPSAPTVSPETINVCGTDQTLTASGCDGIITWNVGATSSSIIISSAGTYVATCSNSCGFSSKSVIVTSNCGCNVSIIEIKASKTAICKSETITLTALGCTSGTVIWSTGQAGTSISVRPLTTSNYTAVCKVSDNCLSKLSNNIQIKVGHIAPPVLACSSTLVCLGETATLKAYGCDGIVIWSNGSTGSSMIVNPDGTTMYSAKCRIDDCESISSEHVAIPIGKPNQPFVSCKNSVICLGGVATLTASGCTGIILWSDGQTGGVIKVSPLTEKTTYSAICQSFGGKCESEKSNEVTVIVGRKVDAPKVIAEISNICPYNTSDLNTAVLSELSTNEGQFEFHTTSSINSPLVTNPSAVSAGEYYVFERSSVGCYSDFASVKVKTKFCEGNGINQNEGFVDISVKKVASASIVPINESVNYKVVVKNVGQNKATGLIVRDILPNSLSFERVSNNATFENGIITAKIDTLKAGDSTTFTYTTKVISAGKIVNKVELFKINETDNVLSNNSSEYTINDLSLGKLLGISKVCEPAIWVRDKVYKVPFVIYITNLGSEDINNLQVKDDLDRAFGNGAKILNDTIQITTDASLAANTNYTGRGLNTNLLIDSLSSIKKGQKLTLRFTVKVDLKDATVNNFFNIAEVNYHGKKDISTTGINADPDDDGDPSNNEEPTKVQFKEDIPTGRPAIGIALSVWNLAKVDSKCHNVTYLALVKNFGNTKLINVQVVDSLSKTFGDSVTYEVVGTPTIGQHGTLKVNPNFNGKEDVNLLIADTSSVLKISQMDSVFFTVRVCHNEHLGPYINYAHTKAISNGNIVSDTSNTGLEIKMNETSPTVVTFPSIVGELVIPEGFSPNGDGKNDKFIISIPTGVIVESIEIYNRWGQLVFKDTSGLITSQGWDGTSNQGLKLSGDGVPDGTYYYSLKLSNETDHRIHFITLVR